MEQPPQSTPEEQLIQAAFGHYQAGRTSEAAALFDQVLDLNPDRLGALLMRGLILLDGDDADAERAEAAFTRCLELSPENFIALNHLGQLHLDRGELLAAVALFERSVARNPAFAPAFNNLGVALHKLGRRSAALAAFDQALALDANLVAVHGNRAQVLADLGRWEEAVPEFQRMAACAPDLAAAWRSLGTACRHVNALAEAEEYCRRAIALDPNDVEALIELATTLERAGRGDEARQTYGAAAQLQGVMVEPCLGSGPQARVLVICAQGGGNVPSKYLFDRARFETISIHLPPPGHADNLDALLSALPEFDIVFSAVGEGDSGDPVLAQMRAVLDRLGRPVLNAPELVPDTARDRLPQVLDGIPGLVVPATRRVCRSELLRLVASVADGQDGPPVLVRPTGSHGGHDLAKISSSSELGQFLEQTPHDEFFASQFFDYRSLDGYYRKYRFLFVDREVFSYHLAVHDSWLIHYFRADMFRQPWMKREEETFLADYRQIFSGPQAEAVQQVARRLNVDYGGLDCALTRDGRVLVFEANPCMLLHLQDSPEEFPYKHLHVPRIVDAVGDLVMRRIG